MSSRRVGRIGEAVARGGGLVGILHTWIAGARREYVLGSFRVTAKELVFACCFASMAGLVVWLFATPPEVWREERALFARREGRIVHLLPLAFLLVAVISRWHALVPFAIMSVALFWPLYRALRRPFEDTRPAR